MASGDELSDEEARAEAHLAAIRRKKAAKREYEAKVKAKHDATVLVEVSPSKPIAKPKPPPSRPAQPQFRPSAFARPAAPDHTPAPAASSMAARLAAKNQRKADAAALPSLPDVQRSTSFSKRVEQPRPVRTEMPRGTGFTKASRMLEEGFEKPRTREGSSSALSAALVAESASQRPKPAPRLSQSARPSGSKSSLEGSGDSGKGKARATSEDDDLEIVRDGTERTEDLTLDAELKMGPGEFGRDPEGEEVWRNVEPNSKIRLSKRVLPHNEVQDLLYGRYFVRPSELYSIVRLSRDGATYDVPVEGDWVTIAVVAERSEIRVSGVKDARGDAEEASSSEEEGDGFDSVKKAKPNKGKGKAKDEKKRVPRKYINLKLVSLPPRSKTLGGGAGVAGDAYLQLLLFESDSIVHGDDGEGGETRTYHGGSGGAYEKWCNLAVGSVVAILNARILRPLRSGAAAPHPLTLPLALNPHSADALTLLGHAADLSTCTATRADGSRCPSWVDTRTGSVCEYHVHLAVKKGRGRRAEFASATTSMDLASLSMPRRKEFGGGGGGGGRIGQPADGDYDTYNPQKQRGLLPRNGPRAAPRGRENGGGGVTYVVGATVAQTGNAKVPASRFGGGETFLTQRSAAGEKRKRTASAAEASLLSLFDGAEDASAGARNLAAVLHGGQDTYGKIKAARREAEDQDKKRVFSAEAVRMIGFDPTGRRSDDLAQRNAAIASLKEKTNRPLNLKGPKRMSCVVVPPPKAATPPANATPARTPPAGRDEDMIDLD